MKKEIKVGDIIKYTKNGEIKSGFVLVVSIGEINIVYQVVDPENEDAIKSHKSGFSVSPFHVYPSQII